MHMVLSLLFTLENFVLLFKGLTFDFKSCVSVNASFCASTVLKNSSTVLGSVDSSPSFAAKSYAYLLGSFVIIAQGLIATPLCTIALWNKPVKVKQRVSWISDFLWIFNYKFNEDTKIYIQNFSIWKNK